MSKGKTSKGTEEPKIVKIDIEPVSFSKLYTYATPLDLLLLAIGALGAIVAGAALPATSILFGNMINIMGDFMAKKTTPSAFMTEISLFASYFCYLGIGVLVCTYMYMSTYIYVGEKQTHRIREEYLKAVVHQNISWFDDLGAGEVTTRITSDTNLVQDGTGEKVAIIFQDIATFISGLVIAFTAEWRLALAVCSIVPVIVVTAIILNKFAGRYTSNALDIYSKAGTLAEEAISSVRTAVAFNQQIKLSNMYGKLMTKAEVEGKKKAIVLAICVGIIFFSIYCGYSISFFYGGQLKSWGLISSGTIVNVFFAILLGAFSLSNIPPHLQAITYARGAGAKLFEAIDRSPPIDSRLTTGAKLPSIEGSIEFSNIKFSYPSRPDVQIFQDYSLKIEPGTSVALVGASGSGKSTTIQLLERFYDPDSGRVLLDGHDIKDLNLKWYRQQLGLVSQEPTLFSGTISDNVAIGLIGTKLEHASKEEQMPVIIDACVKSNAHAFISGLPESYDTQVGERGFLLSGGQKQRIAIARAIVKDPKVLLLDEATSALDTQSEGIVQEALDRASQGRTTIVIAHRLSTIKNSNKIVVMERGRVIEAGNHNELMAKVGGAYRKLVELQDIKKKEEGLEQNSGSASLVEAEGDVEYVDAIIENPDGKTEIVRVATKHSTLSVGSNIEEGVKSEFKTPLWTLVKFIIRTNSPEKVFLGIGTLGATILGLIYPVFAIIFAKLLAATNLENQALLDETAFWALMLFIIALVAGFGQFCSQYGYGTSSEKLSSRLRTFSFNSILWQEVGWFDRDANSTGTLVSALSQDSQDIQGFSGTTFGSIFNIFVNLISSMIVGLAYGWKLALVVIACLPILLYSGYLRIAMIRNFQAKNKESYSRSAEMACENASAIRTVASLTKEDMVIEKYHHALEEPLKAGFQNAVYSSFVFALSMSCNFFINALAFWYGGSLISTGEYDIMNFFTVFMALIIGASGASRVFAYAPDMNKARDAAASIYYLLNRTPHIDSTEEGPGKKIVSGGEKNPIQGIIKFENVHFHYPTRPGAKILKGIDLEIQPGQFVAFVGPSGCGKSTSIGLVERFYDVSKGKVTIDGMDVRDYHLPSLRDNIALVGQEPSLYDLTIRENIIFGSRTYGTTPTLDDVHEAAKAANIHDFIMTLPDGYETRVGGKGTQLSGGQKQRIAIARALVRNPSILLLDEATSALDAESEKVVQAALDKASKGRTTLSIAHRLSTIQHADLILVLKDGHIVEKGTHDQLLGLLGVYYDMVQQQILDRDTAE